MSKSDAAEHAESEHKANTAKSMNSLAPLMEKFTNSLSYDKRMWVEDIKVSQAYARVLEKAKLLTKNETNKICTALNQVRDEWSSSNFEVKQGDEDIHTANIRRLKEIVGGQIGGKLATGRSINDQIVTVMRLWLRNGISLLNTILKDLIQAFCSRAENEIDILMPGYTHLQKAQPVRWSHWLLSHCWYICQDYDRLCDLMRRVNVLPLGSGAIAGNPFNIDRNQLASDLGFEKCSPNSMMAVSDRDFVVEFLAWASLISVHLSRLAEDLIIFSTEEFGFITIADAYCNAGSTSFDKKKPISLELMRAQSGQIIGACTGLLIVIKGLPSAFNRDLQEDKAPLFDTYDKLCIIIQIASGTILSLKIDDVACYKALSPAMLSNDITYYLVKKGTPFMEAQANAKRILKLAEEKFCSITDLTFEEIQSVSKKFEPGFMETLNYEHSVEQYKSKGGTSRDNVKIQLEQISQFLKSH